MTIGEMNIPKRTIMTPGPVEVHPRVLRALSSPVLGQFDPAFTDMMNDVMALLRQIFRTTNKWAFPIDGTSRAGLEAVLASLIKPGTGCSFPFSDGSDICLPRFANGTRLMFIQWNARGETFLNRKRSSPKSNGRNRRLLRLCTARHRRDAFSRSKKSAGLPGA